MVGAGCACCPCSYLQSPGVQRPVRKWTSVTGIASGYRIHGNVRCSLRASASRTSRTVHVHKIFDVLHENSVCQRNSHGFHSRVVARAQRDESVPGASDDDSQQPRGSDVGPTDEKSGKELKSAVRRGASLYFEEFKEELKSATGIDPASVKAALVSRYKFVKGFIDITSDKARDRTNLVWGEGKRLKDGAEKRLEVLRSRYWPQLLAYNRWELWKNVKQWDARRAGTLVLYVLFMTACARGVYSAVTRPRLSRSDIQTLANEYMEAVIPLPTAKTIRKLKKSLFRHQMPKGLKVEKHVLGQDGLYHRDPSYVGENAWEEADDEASDAKAESPAKGGHEQEELVATHDEKAIQVGEDEKKQEEEWSRRSWQERLNEWKRILSEEKVRELTDQTTRYSVIASMPEVRANYIAEQEAKRLLPPTFKPSFWVARRWWKYRPKLPYTYFLSQLENLQVASAVFSTDMRKLYVTMKDGFPSEFVVDVPVDPYLYPKLKNCMVDVDILSRSNLSFYFRVLISILPGVLIITYIRALLYRAKEKMSEKIYDLLTMNHRQLILPEVAADKAKSQYKDVVVGGDVWVVLDEIMTYMRDPLKYHSKRVKLPRGILISGPPGTGKTLLARAIARESGLPFVFASGAEFVESSTGNGSDKVFDIFFTARANAPSFVFIDEIDALAGKHLNDDAERRATFEQLLAELDGEPEDTDVDRFSLRQAVILIAATNRPDELDERLMVPGRIDREIHIGLPGEVERIQIFGVHSEGKKLAKDVDFSKFVYRTIGYSGADIRNFINEAGIVAVRRGHTEISQLDFLDVLDKQLFEGMGMVLTDDEQQRIISQVPDESKKLLAVHEAGHILLAHLFPRFDWHAFSHLLPGGKDTALTVFFPREEMLQLGCTTVGYLKMQMVVAHGGRCAERIMNGVDITDGGQDDLLKISKIARELAITVASPRIGLFPKKWQGHLDPPSRPDEVELIPNEWDKPGSHIVNMSKEFSELFTREVRRYIDETEDQAMEGLQKNRHILERLVSELVVRTKISGIEAEAIIKSMNPEMLPDPTLFPEINFEEFVSPMKAYLKENPSAPPNMRGRYDYMDIYPAPLHRC